jgi:phage-related protein (TIGR01555 family)
LTRAKKWSHDLTVATKKTARAKPTPRAPAPKAPKPITEMQARDASPYRGASFDAIYNYLSGQGGRNDKSLAAEWMTALTVNHQEVTNVFRVSWIARKVVAKKPKDMLRSGYDFVWEDSGKKVQTGRESNTEMDALRRGIAAYNADVKLIDAKTWARLYGGAIMLLGIDGQDLTQPLPVKDRKVDYSSVGKNGLKYVHVFDRWQAAHSGEIDSDTESPNAGKPLNYIINATDVNPGQKVHWTRVIRFDGAKVPWWTFRQNACWHDSELQVLMDGLKQYDATTGGITHMIQEANIDVIKATGLTETLATASGQEGIEARYGLTSRYKSMFNMLIIDKDAEDYERHPFQFSGLDRIWEKNMVEVAGAADYPVAVLFGRSPAGLNATGESDMQLYYDDLSALRESELRPQHAQLLEVIARSTLGRLPDGFSFTYRSLWEPTAVERSTMQTNRANRDKIYLDLGIVTPGLVAKELKEDSVYKSMTQEDVDLAAELEELPEIDEDDGAAEVDPAQPGAAGAKPKAPPFGKEDAEEDDEDDAEEAQDAAAVDWNPDQQRDEGGRFAGEGGSVGTTRSGKSVEAPALNATFITTEANRQHPEKDFLPISALEHVEKTSLGFSKQDHFDAHKLLIGVAKQQFAKGNVERAHHIAAVASAHRYNARNYGKGLQPAKGSA